MNVVVLRGSLARPGQVRTLPSGDELLALEVTIQRDGERAETVPVVWVSPSASATTLDVDERVVVVGRVRRRFYRSAGTTQSRTEVVADSVLPVRSRRVAAALARASAAISEPE